MSLVTQEKVAQWIRQDPAALRGLLGPAAVEEFRTIRAAILGCLLRQPTMWLQQTRHVLGGCLHYLGVLMMGMPTVQFWVLFLAEAIGDGPPVSGPPRGIEPIAPDPASLLLLMGATLMLCVYTVSAPL